MPAEPPGASVAPDAAPPVSAPRSWSSRLIHEVRLVFVALQFFTRVPVPRWVGFEPDWLHQSARHFSLIGVFVGAFGAAVLWAASQVLSLPVAVGLSMAATMLLTGGFHEDGWADTCDALGGGAGGAVGRERALQIMKDSRIGAYGAMGLLTLLALKAATLASMPVAWGCAALLLGHAASRAAAVSLIRVLPYAGDIEHAKAKPLAQRISTAGFAVACGWALAVSLALVLWRPSWAVPVIGGLVFVALGALWCARWFRRRLGGVTGDTLGAAQQLTELLLLLSWAAAWGGVRGA